MKEWHLTYLAAGIPADYFIRDTDYCCARIGENAPAGFEELAQRIPVFANFLAGNPLSTLTTISYKIRSEKRQEAIDHTLFKVNSFLDGYSIVTEIVAPRLAPIALAREDLGEDLEVLLVRESAGWAHCHSPEKTECGSWIDFEKKLLGRILHFFNIASGDAQESNCEIAQQILQSTKAYRAAIASGSYGIEYLCKFAALEGLVCGPQTSNKKKLLKSRLGALFRKNLGVESMVLKLWERRSEAIHSGQLSHHDLLANSYPLQVKVNDIHYLFAGVLVFALDNLSAQSIAKLWDEAGKYELPDWLIAPNPSHQHRIALTLFVENTNIVWNGMGKVTDKFFPR